MKPQDIKSFEELEKYLAHFTTWDGDHVHDFTGAVVLLGALLDNIRTYSLEVDLNVIGNYLTDEQKVFLKKIAELAQRTHED